MIKRIVVLVLALALSGCEMAAYYLQAIGGHLEIMGRAQPLDRLLDDPATPPTLKARLVMAAAIREFASRELGLPDNGSYRSYADLGRAYAVWNVVAAPEFALQPVQSCFPVAGCVSYRGFYAREDAVRHAARLRAEGNDVYMGGVPAYSTLGWFDDPLLSSFIRYPDAELARLVFHELSHQLVYLKGDSTFNESFAVAVEREGVRRWLKASGRAAELRLLDDVEQRRRDLAQLMAAARERLQRLYREPLPPQEMRAHKLAAFAALRSDYEALKAGPWRGFAGYDHLFTEQAANNALLASFATYTQLVEGFERLLAAEGGDLAGFYAKVKELATQEKPARDAVLKPR